MCRHNMLGTHATFNGFTLQHQFCVCVFMCTICCLWLLKAYEMLELQGYPWVTLPCKATQRLLSALNQHFSQRFTFISRLLTHFFLSAPSSSLLPLWRVYSTPAFPLYILIHKLINNIYPLTSQYVSR